MRKQRYDLPNPYDPTWVSKNPGSSYFCSICGERTMRSERWDAYYCLDCNRWEEEGCTDPACYYCANRPTHPKDPE